MNKVVLIFLILIFTLLSCDKPVPKPEKVIPKKEMIEILTETYLNSNLRGIKKSVKPINYVEEQAFILQQKGYDWQTFKDNYTYYMLDDKSAKDINDGVRKRLEKIKPKKDSTQTKPAKKVNTNRKKAIDLKDSALLKIKSNRLPTPKVLDSLAKK